MSAFKDQVAKDIKQVFINPLEFADMHNIRLVGWAGADVLCVIDRDETTERSSTSATEYAEGIFKQLYHLYVATTDLLRKPVENELLWIDNHRYLVFSVFEDMGMYEITLEANES